ncbi:MAG: ABC transporter ATP-binding protein, partial [Proteobacteria bacterium]|nr:ABC transporter ATP-binding protein [Pseudomonadota bacterium]
MSKRYAMGWQRVGGLKSMLLNPRASLGHLQRPAGMVLDDITLHIAPGEAVGVIGPNGAGKSTLLGLVAGVIRPTLGTVETAGRIAPLLELGAGFHPDLSGRDNIVLNGVLLGLTRAEARARVAEIVAFAELENEIDAPVRVYSSGMQARLGFSVAAHLSPDILLIDETLAVGDADFQAKCIAKLRDFTRRGATILCVSHAMEQIRAIATRVIELRNHRIVYDGAPPAADAVAPLATSA